MLLWRPASPGPWALGPWTTSLEQGIILELSRNYLGIIPELSRNYGGGAVAASAARNLPSTRAGGQDDGS